MTSGVSTQRMAGWVLSGLLLLALALGLTACGGGGTSVSSNPGGGESTSESVEVSDSEIDSITLGMPLVAEVLSTTRASTQALGLTLLGMEPLLRYEEGEVVPWLAESYDEASPTKYVFHLRKGVKFWDGTPLTAEDVVYSYEAQTSPKTESYIAQQWSGVKSVKASGSEVTVELKSPNPQFVYTVAQTGIFSAKYAKQAGSKLGTPKVKNMGTGPYEFESFKPLSSLELVRNENYWGEEPHIGHIEAKMLPPDALLLAAQSGELDGIFNIPVSQVTAIEGVPSYSISSDVDDSVYKFDFSVKKAPWNDIHLRRALAYCIDREAIAEAVFSKGAEVTSTLVPPSIAEAIMPSAEIEAGYGKIESIVPGFDLKKAEAELAKSNSPDGLKTTVLVTATDPNLSAIVQIVAQEAAKIGIDIEVKEVDDITYYTAVYFGHTGGGGLGIDNYSADGPDPINIPVSVLSSANAIPQGSGVNSADYENAKVDNLLSEYMALPRESDKRGPVLLEILEQAATDLPYAPMVFPEAFLGLSSEFSYPGYNTFWWLENWPENVGLGAG